MAFQPSNVESKSPWLAITFGCCASRRDSIDDDHQRGVLPATSESEMRICYDQPQIVPFPRAESIQPRPSTAMSRQVSQWVSNGREFATRASSRASLHTLSRPRRSHSRPRPSIGRPMDFRHFDGVDGSNGIQSMLDDVPMPVRRRRSFRPLELSIYLPDGRLSPLPDFTDDWTVRPVVDLEFPADAVVRERDSRTNSISSNASHLIQRKPVGSGSRRSSVQSQHSVQSRPPSGTLSTLPHLVEEPRSRPVSNLSDRPPLQRANTAHGTLSPNTILSRLPSPNRSRASTAPSRPVSVRRAKVDVDDEIRELNTIIEERRADAYRSTNLSPALINRPPLSPSHHVPALAPTLRMHVRSETLSDIGSAFSVPLAGRQVASPPPGATSTPRSLSRTTTGLTLAPPSRTGTGPLNSNPVTPPTPTIPTPTTPIHRLGAWLKRSLPTTPSSPPFFRTAPTTPAQNISLPTTPFYQCEPAALQRPRTPPSRPSTSGSAGSATLHTRHPSNDTATVTLLSSSASYSTTPTLSSRSASPDHSPPTPARVNILRGEGKTRRVPAPLVLAKEKEFYVEAALGSARSVTSVRSRELKPPQSPNYKLLRGMEVCAPAERGRGAMEVGEVRTPVGVAF
ncbi:hypothetical protein BS50DRAFT_279319 [Corynespora cassiicola Philippines]|uniref:Uncharacterized protein n=1 Tax=Corynespora cassiicola Philippines TaxID=1448308 RepID=A0A2T2P0U4_CORCC|nr:hypothetical protein BS50DRAFT_279319 [Corynespora cassiicola Philippines]